MLAQAPERGINIRMLHCQLKPELNSTPQAIMMMKGQNFPGSVKKGTQRLRKIGTLCPDLCLLFQSNR